MIAAVFPGQGSQKPGMGRSLYEGRPEAKQVFDEVSEAVGVDLAKLCFESDEDALRETQNAQLALFTVGVASFVCLQDSGIQVQALAGHSVGEYAALAAAGVVPVSIAARLVKRRGELMAVAGKEHPGTMAAVLGLERSDLDAVCVEVSGIVVVANDNCPGQLVISGEVEAVRAAGELAASRGAKRVLPLNVSGAFHSPLMEEPARQLGEALMDAEFGLGIAPVYSNVTAEPALDAERWSRLLEDQLRSPVRWTESVRNMVRDGVTTFVECGPGEVLSGLIRRIHKEATTLRTGDLESLDAALATLSQPG